MGRTRGTFLSCRNYAVLMARACGLERILLIDDDIVVEDPRLPNQTLSLLDASVLCVGALTVGKPDDSVTGHLARSVDWDAPRFVSGQYLALQTAFVSAPFPDTYNEDWLLILMNVGRRRIVSHSAVTQIVSEPRLTLLETALFQEFGEVASEGAIVALHSSASLLDQGTPFWVDVLLERRARLRDLRGDLKAGKQIEGVAIVDAVLRYHQDLDAGGLVRFLRSYRDATEQWGSRLGSVDPLGLAISEACRVIP